MAELNHSSTSRSIPDDRLARVHAIWGLGQVARQENNQGRTKKRDTAFALVTGFLGDSDPEMRAQAAKTLGDPGVYLPAATPLIELLQDDSPRVRYHAARTLGVMRHREAIPFLVGVVMENDNADPFLRHAVSTALWRIANDEDITELAAHPMPAVRMAAVLAMRRDNAPALERLIHDKDPAIALEAARAVHDKPIPQAMPALAALADNFKEATGGMAANDPRITPLLRRVISANQKLGGSTEVASIASIARNTSLPRVVRMEALEAMRDFESPAARDRVLGWWRPVENGPRDREMIAEVLTLALPPLASDQDPDIRSSAIDVAGAYEVALDPDALFQVAVDDAGRTSDRIACIEQLPGEDEARLEEALVIVLASDSSMVRIAGRKRLMQLDPGDAESSYLMALDSSDLPERQNAVAVLGQLDTDRSHAALERLSMEMRNGTLDPGLQLDVITTGANTDWWSSGDLSAWDVAIHGGDPKAGKRLVRYHSSATCLRCHQIEGHGGTAGPKLDGAGSRLDRPSLLASLISPQESVDEKYGDASAMPNMRDLLSPREIRDVVAYLATLKEASNSKGH